MISLNKKTVENRNNVYSSETAEYVFAFFLPLMIICLTLVFPVEIAAHGSMQIQFSSTPVKCWENSTLTKNLIAASDKDNFIIILSSDNKIQSINSENGEVNWVYEIGGNNISNFIISDRSLYVAGSVKTIGNNVYGSEKLKPEEQKTAQFYLRSININSGIPNRSFMANRVGNRVDNKIAKINLKDKAENENSNNVNEKIYLGQNENGVFLMDSSGNLITSQKNTDSIEWSRKFDSTVTEFFDLGTDGNPHSNLSPKIFAFYTADKKFYLLTSKTGESIRSFTQPYTVTSAVMSSTGNLIVGDEKGNISLINFENKDKLDIIWKIKIGAGISSLTLTKNGVLITSLDNFVYLINQEKGNRIWKKRLSGRLLYKPLHVEKEKIFVVAENDSAYFISLENGSIIHQIRLTSGDYFINTPVFVNNQYIFPTSSGIVSFSNSRCS